MDPYAVTEIIIASDKNMICSKHCMQEIDIHCFHSKIQFVRKTETVGIGISPVSIIKP